MGKNSPSAINTRHVRAWIGDYQALKDMADTERLPIADIIHSLLLQKTKINVSDVPSAQIPMIALMDKVDRIEAMLTGKQDTVNKDETPENFVDHFHSCGECRSALITDLRSRKWKVEPPIVIQISRAQPDL